MIYGLLRTEADVESALFQAFPGKEQPVMLEWHCESEGTKTGTDFNFQGEIKDNKSIAPAKIIQGSLLISKLLLSILYLLINNCRNQIILLW